MSDFSRTTLRHLRERAGLRREHVAVRLDRSVQTVRAWETGVALPPTAILPKLAAIFGCEPGDFFCGGDAS